MFYGELDAKDLTLDGRELSARLSVPLGRLPDETNECRLKLADASNAAYSAVTVDCTADSDGILRIGDVFLSSSALCKSLDGCKKALLLTVTLGVRSERYLRACAASSPSLHFITDAVADAMVEAAADEAEKIILGEVKHRVRFSPGYSDLPLSFTAEILRLTNAKKLMGITLSDTFLATPSKTVTAIIGLKE